MLYSQISNETFYNSTTKEIINNGNNFTLTNNEIIILEMLLEKKGQIITYSMCINKLGGEISDAALKNIILRLRKKIGEKHIKNLSKVGYVLTCD